MNELEKARVEIDAVDTEMRALFVRRMRAARVIGQYKNERGLPITDAERERAIIGRGVEKLDVEELKPYYVSFLQNTMEISKAYQRYVQRGLKIAYCGVAGAFAYGAAGEMFPDGERVPYPDFGSAYAAVERGECELCVLPLENSSNGEVGAVSDLLFSGSLFINDVREVPIHHNLCGLSDAKESDIRTVVSHAQALGQCAAYLSRRGIRTEEYPNTATAAIEVHKRADVSVGAICTAQAAELAGLKVLKENIETSALNTTRFAVLSRVAVKREKSLPGEHFILCFTTKNEAGSLAYVLSIIAKHGYNLRTLRSRPMKDLLWNYYFYLEAEGSLDGEGGRDLLAELSEVCDRIKVAGTYIKH